MRIVDPLVKPEDDSDLPILFFVILAYAGIYRLKGQAESG